jgi:hypothetical protein
VNEIDLILARAQVRMATMTLMMFFIVLMTLLLSLTKAISIGNEANILLTAMTGVLGTIVTQQQGYFFARHRQPTIPAPAPVPPTT